MTTIRRKHGLYYTEGDGYIFHKTIRMQTEAWTLLDGKNRLYALIHEARTRRELIL
jgi:hypothetical protein